MNAESIPEVWTEEDKMERRGYDRNKRKGLPVTESQKAAHAKHSRILRAGKIKPRPTSKTMMQMTPEEQEGYRGFWEAKRTGRPPTDFEQAGVTAYNRIFGRERKQERRVNEDGYRDAERQRTQEWRQLQMEKDAEGFLSKTRYLGRKNRRKRMSDPVYRAEHNESQKKYEKCRVRAFKSKAQKMEAWESQRRLDAYGESQIDGMKSPGKAVHTDHIVPTSALRCAGIASTWIINLPENVVLTTAFRNESKSILPLHYWLERFNHPKPVVQCARQWVAWVLCRIRYAQRTIDPEYDFTPEDMERFGVTPEDLNRQE